jgi:hypothetical protein
MPSWYSGHIYFLAGSPASLSKELARDRGRGTHRSVWCNVVRSHCPAPRPRRWIHGLGMCCLSYYSSYRCSYLLMCVTTPCCSMALVRTIRFQKVLLVLGYILHALPSIFFFDSKYSLCPFLEVVSDFRATSLTRFVENTCNIFIFK